MSDWKRFLTHVRKQSNGCWEWTASKRGKYGNFWICGGIIGAHRFSYLYHNGEIPEGHHIHHKCHNTICVNPEHLEAITPKTHLYLSDTFQRRNSLKTHCHKGHEFTPENIIKRKWGKECRECSRIRHRKWAKENREYCTAYTKQRRLKNH